MFKPDLKNNRILRSQQVLNALIAIVRPYLPLDLRNTRITAEDIIAVLGYASVHRISMDAACNELKEAPSANRLREVLVQALPDREILQRALNTILRAQTPRFIKKGKRAYYTPNGVIFNFYFWLNSDISGFEVSNRCEACNDKN